MCKEKAKPMGCTRNSWIKSDTLEWYGATLHHHNQPRVVKEFCCDLCDFPTCLVALVREDEAISGKNLVPDDDGIAQGRTPARAYANDVHGERALDEGQLQQIGLWASSEGGES